MPFASYPLEKIVTSSNLLVYCIQKDTIPFLKVDHHSSNTAHLLHGVECAFNQRPSHLHCTGKIDASSDHLRGYQAANVCVEKNRKSWKHRQHSPLQLENTMKPIAR
jgi:hypothetical protein